MSSLTSPARLWIAAALGVSLVFGARAAAAAASVRADVAWTGACDERGALAEEMRSRGAELVEAGGSDGALALRVEVTRRRPAELSAELELAASHGARELRQIRARDCEELRQTVAWVLVTLAKERIFTAHPSGPAPTAAFPVDAATGVVVPAASHARFASSTSRSPESEREPELPYRPANESRLGSALVGAFGFAPAPALGPSLFLEHRTELPWLSAVRLSALRLATLPFQRGGANLSIERLAARVGVGVQTGWTPLGVIASVEGGRLFASGSGAELRAGRKDAAGWLALGLAAGLELPLVRRVLDAELGLGLDYVPLEYSFRYGTGEEVSHSEPFELRAQLGLSARL